MTEPRCCDKWGSVEATLQPRGQEVERCPCLCCRAYRADRTRIEGKAPKRSRRRRRDAD